MPLPALSADDLLRHLADAPTEAALRERLSDLSDTGKPRRPNTSEDQGADRQTNEDPRG